VDPLVNVFGQIYLTVKFVIGFNIQ
jgi:hypothetical protein